MPFNLVAVEAQKIDVSQVEDIERERLQVTFKNGDMLFFRVDLGENGRSAPQLILDPSMGAGGDVQSHLAELFYDKRSYRTLGQKTRDVLLMRPSFARPYAGWTIEKVRENLQVKFDIGRPGVGRHSASALQVGALLELEYCTYYSNPVKEPFSRRGVVVAVDSYVIAPTPAAPVSFTQHMSEA